MSKGVITLTERRVRTTEGARLFGQPIGSVIQDRSSPEIADTKRATSLTRLRSLQRQFLAAKAVGDTNRMKDIQAQFTAALKDYSSTNQWIHTIDSLVSDRGRNDQALGRKADVSD